MSNHSESLTNCSDTGRFQAPAAVREVRRTAAVLAIRLRATAQRGDITLWISGDALASWKPEPSGLRGAERKLSDHAIETALTLRLIFKLPLRQAECFLRSILSLMQLALEAPDHTTMSRRGQNLNVDLHRVSVNQPIHLISDSTGLSIVGEGEWAAAKYGGRGRRGWKKLHIGVDRRGTIVAEALTDGDANDAKTALTLIDNVEGDTENLTADSAYDTLASYDVRAARRTEVTTSGAALVYRFVQQRRLALRAKRPTGLRVFRGRHRVGSKL